MLSSGIIDLAIGLAFVFGVTAALASVVTELISRFLGLRGAYLLGGLRELLDTGEQVETDLTKAKKDYDAWKNIVTRTSTEQTGTPTEENPQSATGAVLGSPILRTQGMVGDITSRKLLVQAGKPGRPSVRNVGTKKHAALSDLRSLPAYISPTAFADAVIDLLVPKPTAQTTPVGQTTATGQTSATGQTTLDTVKQSLQKIMSQDPMPADMAPLMPLMTSVNTLVTTAEDDITSVRTSIENWYNDHMDRVSGWYKRHVAWFTIIAGAILVILLNVNTITIGRALYSNSVIGSAVATAAGNRPPCTTADSACLGRAPDRPGDRGPSRAADRLGHGLRLRRRAPGLQLVAGAGHYRHHGQLRLADPARRRRLPDHDRGADARRAVLVRPAGQAGHLPLDRP